MKAINITGIKNIGVVDIDEPGLAADEVVIRMEFGP